MKTADALKRDVLEELSWQPELSAAAIGVAVQEDGVVTLSGHVPSYLEKKVAEAAVKRLAGVKAVVDELQVRLPPAAERDDTDIAAAVVHALQWNVAVPDEHIGVVVEDGRVTLEGQVEWQHQREAAERAVRVLRGVKAVDNLITIAPPVTTPGIAHEIEAALRRSALLEGQRVKVDVVDGKAVLRGSVRTHDVREAAEAAAWSALGVKEVENHLEVVSSASTEI
jgi:osmotically-inducible protein OsmY